MRTCSRTLIPTHNTPTHATQTNPKNKDLHASAAAKADAASRFMRAKEAYDRLLFREALKAAAYELGTARDVYR